MMRPTAIKPMIPALALPLIGLAVPALAQDAEAPAATVETVVETLAPIVDKGDTTWMMISAILVMAMSIPGLALFYGGLVRAKNMLSVLMQVFTIFCIMSILWVCFGYSLAFTGAGSAEEATWLTPFIGGLSKAFLAGVDSASLAETFTTNVYVPEYVFIIFQMAFACIAPALIVGATVERMKFAAVLAFVVIWFFFSYLPMAHMVWWWGGPSAYDAPGGFLFGHGDLDFAGGTVIHINAGVAGLVAALVVGPRLGYGKELMAPHNLPFTFLGGCLLWIGWFGFNAGSNMEATGTAAMAILNTTVATAAAALAWAFGEWLLRGHPSLLGGVSGAIAGLVGITPAAGFVGPMGAIVIGLAAGFLCMWFVVSLKAKLGVDESLDVFGIHGIGGIVGAILTGVFAAPSLGGSGIYDYATESVVAGYDIAGQVMTQTLGVTVAVVWSAVVSFIALMIVKAVIGLRVSGGDERQGLDVTTHGENAYNS
ncbi:ammonium transporter [Paracoccus sp. APAP_BH8]|uniref:Ammonium transporter n=2 Tax=Paracoccus pantotrophus TaxID=82367 RepID=A0AAE6NZ08_PARPN|nr:ammonium transporter [Paracoccus pantotrophus]MDF3855433.1 ammonium transporter [Paracoccus pantotrophus]QFG37847.1 ammonium transporter [Paracoccus pantotrophus]RDD96337.1 ammonium transporter [Paracoccus pantotrophus]RNI20598.1 ammonium transporter [Paracoccus pantotrophus]WGR65531.1 ammonium transporter [Paracoccus pantotrophus]